MKKTTAKPKTAKTSELVEHYKFLLFKHGQYFESGIYLPINEFLNFNLKEKYGNGVRLITPILTSKTLLKPAAEMAEG